MMKRILALAAAMLLTLSAFAQEGRALYNKYSGKPSVSAVYISPAMFRLVGDLPDLKVGDGDVNITPIIKSLSGFYLIDLSSAKPELRTSLEKDVESWVKSGKYELLLEANDSGEKVSIWTISKASVIQSLVMLADGALICVDGEIPESELNKLLADAMKD